MVAHKQPAAIIALASPFHDQPVAPAHHVDTPNTVASPAPIQQDRRALLQRRLHRFTLDPDHYALRRIEPLPVRPSYLIVWMIVCISISSSTVNGNLFAIF